MELLTTFVPAVGPACCWVVTVPGAMRPDSGSWAAGEDRCAPPPPNWAQDKGAANMNVNQAASQAGNITRWEPDTVLEFYHIHTCMYIMDEDGRHRRYDTRTDQAPAAHRGHAARASE